MPDHIHNGDVQLDEHGRLRHLLTINGLSREILLGLLDSAGAFIQPGGGAHEAPPLHGSTVINLFFEPSTRTRTTFEIAATRLGANVINLDSRRLSTNKGETLLDTVRTLEAMGADIMVIRDAASGSPQLVAQHVTPGVHIINAGDGRHAHPTQALLDLFTIRKHRGDFRNLRVAIVGDILRSRVARSLICALNVIGGVDIRVIAPLTLLPTGIEKMGVAAHTGMQSGLDGVNVIIMLRLQMERMEGQLIPSAQEYFNCYGLTEEKLRWADDEVIIMHPGPINRGLEIASSVADGARSLILGQVTNGIAVRMAVMAQLAGHGGRR